MARELVDLKVRLRQGYGGFARVLYSVSLIREIVGLPAVAFAKAGGGTWI